MKKIRYLPYCILCIILSFAIIVCSISVLVYADEKKNFIKWAEFKIPSQALELALKADIDNHTSQNKTEFCTVLSILGAKYWGEWSRFKKADLDKTVDALKNGNTVSDLTAGYDKFNYFYSVYHAVLGGMVGEYELGKDTDVYGNTIMESKYGLKAYSPIAYGFSFSHYKDFGSSRSYGYSRPHLGNDLMARVGTPVVAVESGTVTNCGWNKYGGWRLGIRSFDGLRYYYYAHFRKDHPYPQGIKEGTVVSAGQVVGYVGMTGYNDQENINGMKTPHLHFGVQLIFDPSQEEGENEIWIDVYQIVNFLEHHKSVVVKNEGEEDYHTKYTFLDSAITSSPMSPGS